MASESKETFIDRYCRCSDVKWGWLQKYKRVEPCDCGAKACTGWQMVPIDEPQIPQHGEASK
jgi:hypothetical protein